MGIRFSRWIKDIVEHKTTLESDDLVALATDEPAGAAISYTNLSAQIVAGATSKVTGLNGATGLWIGTQTEYDAVGAYVPTVAYLISGP